MIPKYCQQVYAILWNRFGENTFSTKDLIFLDVFFSSSMKKKVLFSLNKDEWIIREGRGLYRCLNPKSIFESFFKPKVSDLLTQTKMKWAFTGLNALEVYSDFSVCHRSWLSSPFFIKILKKDLKQWISTFQKNDVPFFINDSRPQFGEYVVLVPKDDFDYRIVNGYPVEPLDDVIKFSKKRSYEFAYEIDYLGDKYGKRIRATRS